MIKAIIFDIGGVLVEENFYTLVENLAHKHNIDPEELKEFIKPIFRNEIMIGAIPESQMWKRVSDHFDLSLDTEGLHNELGRDHYSRREPVWEYIRRLDGKYELAILSNLGLESISMFADKMPEMTKYFKTIVYSAEVGMKKPDPEVYQHVLDQLKLSADECIFIDDKPKNIEAANKLGIHGIVYTNPVQLKADLATLGIIVN